MDVELTSRHEWGCDRRYHERTYVHDNVDHSKEERGWKDGWHWYQTFQKSDINATREFLGFKWDGDCKTLNTFYKKFLVYLSESRIA